MFRFTYPLEKFDEANLDKNIIRNLITQHEALAAKFFKNYDYYTGKHLIRDKKRDGGTPNARVVCNHAKDIADTAAGYFMGNPITYSDSDGMNIDKLLEAFDDADVDDVDAENALDMGIFGVAYEYVYAKEGESVPTSKTISPMSTFIVVDDTIEENELCGVYYYRQENSVTKEWRYVATVSTANYTYVLNILGEGEISSVVTEQPTPHYFGEPQIVEYLNNKEGIGDFEQQIGLIDAYNTLMSDRVNDKEQFIDAIMVLYGAMLGDDEEEIKEAHEQLKQDKLLELPTDARAEYLTRQMDEGGAETLRKALKEDIYSFSHVPNFSDENFAGNASGVAMEYKLLGLEMLTKIKERYYKKGLKKRIRLYCNYLGMKAIALNDGSIMPTFSRSLPKNLQELATIVSNLSGTVSERTLLKLLPFVEDPDYEIEEVEKEKAADVQRQQEMFGGNPNTPPEEEKEETEEVEEEEE